MNRQNTWTITSTHVALLPQSAKPFQTIRSRRMIAAIARARKRAGGVNPMRVRHRYPIPGNVVSMDKSAKIQAEIERVILPVSQTR
jgi:hypothetical protein